MKDDLYDFIAVDICLKFFNPVTLKKFLFLPNIKNTKLSFFQEILDLLKVTFIDFNMNDGFIFIVLPEIFILSIEYSIHKIFLKL